MDLLVIGLDGVSTNMLSEFEVETPFLSAVQEEGVGGVLSSVDTPTTLPAWTSFATGMDPGSHGLTNMVRQSSDYEIEAAPSDTTHPALYDFLSEAIIVNLPGAVTRTPTAPGTHLVSSFLCSDKHEAVPAELQDLSTFENYRIHDNPERKATPEQYVEDLREVTEARYNFAAEAFDRYDPRVGFVLFSTPDWVGHFLSYGTDDETRAEWYRRIVELADDRASALAERADNVLLLSDHGFEHKPKAIHLQTWFREEGYLTTTANQSTAQRLVTGTAKYVAKRFEPLYDLIRNVYFRVIHTSGGEAIEDVVDMNPDVDFAASQAWHLRYGCIYINDDRFASPEVEDPESMRRELRDRLATLTDADGDPIFSDVLVAEEAYEAPGPDAPDIIARPAPGYVPLRAFSPRDEYVIDKPGNTEYDHRYEGLIAAAGPLFTEGVTVDGMSIVDVVPTLLHALEEPLSTSFDGTVRTELLATDEQPTYLSPEDVPEPGIQSERAAGEESGEALDRLEELGYLE